MSAKGSVPYILIGSVWVSVLLRFFDIFLLLKSLLLFTFKFCVDIRVK